MDLTNEGLMDSGYRLNDKARMYNNGNRRFNRNKFSNIEASSQSATRPTRVVGESVEVSLNPPSSSTSTSTSTSTSLNPPFNPNVSVVVTTQPASTTAPSSTPAPSAIATSTPASTAQTQTSPAPASTMPKIMPMGGGGTAPAQTTDGGGSGAKEGTVVLEEKCKSYYWILGLAVGAVAGYLYAKGNKKGVLNSVLISSAIGGGAGYLVDIMVCKKKVAKPVNAPAPTPSSTPAPSTTQTTQPTQ